MIDVLAVNALDDATLRTELTRCCGSHCWVEAMMTRRPFADTESLLKAAKDIWFSLGREDWLEAFTHHPKIGDIYSLQQKFGNTRSWAEGEQAGVQQATDDVLQALADGNRLYEEKFGYIFIVCATGKTAAEMLALLNGRLPNDPDTELQIAAQEQFKITCIRLEKLWT